MCRWSKHIHCLQTEKSSHVLQTHNYSPQTFTIGLSLFCVRVGNHIKKKKKKQCLYANLTSNDFVKRLFWKKNVYNNNNCTLKLHICYGAVLKLLFKIFCTFSCKIYSCRYDYNFRGKIAENCLENLRQATGEFKHRCGAKNLLLNPLPWSLSLHNNSNFIRNNNRRFTKIIRHKIPIQTHDGLQNHDNVYEFAPFLPTLT